MEEKEPAVVLTFRGSLSRYGKELELALGWHRLANVEDYAGLGSQAYRKIGMGGPQRTITFFATSKMEDYWEQGLEVLVGPLLEEKMREV